MRNLQMIRELLIVATLSVVLATVASARFAPESFGRWLQQIDTGRFEMIDCDCTDAFE